MRLELPSADVDASVAATEDSEMTYGDDEDVDGDTGLSHRFQDSDDEDDNDDVVMTDSIELQLPQSASEKTHVQRDSDSWDTMEEDRPDGASNSNEVVEQREALGVPSRASQPGTPLQQMTRVLESDGRTVTTQNCDDSGRSIPGPKKVRVVVKDAAYSTYRAVLHYVSLCHRVMTCDR